MRYWPGWLVACSVLLGSCAGCDRGTPDRPNGNQAAAADATRVPPPAVKPDYSFAETTREQYPEIVSFVQHFLETCLAGDYASYRMMASRLREPESRERFQTIFHAIRALHIDLIERLDRPQIAPELYRVVATITLDPESKARLRRKTDQIAILVLKEEGEWRVLPAPAELQPQPDEPPSSAGGDDAAGGASTSAPSYPWDQDGDY